MNYHIVLTRKCNLNCKYCHGGEETGPNTEIQYSLEDLSTFLENDSCPQLMFYGGEPTLRINLMQKIMDLVSDGRFMLQTNGLLLHRIPKDYIRRIHSILVSIDGPRDVTDYYRSRGVYDQVLKNVRWLRNVGFEGDIVARMAVSQQSDIFRDVSHLLDLQDPSFDHVHWQLNVVWDAEGNWIDFDRWVKESYKPGIERLVRRWVDKMQEGVLEGIVPFLPVTYTLLTGRTSRLRCGSGLDTFAIHTNGTIGVCPISPDWDFSIVGDIHSTNPEGLKDIMTVIDPCPSCKEYGVCGGRCLFANRQRLWGNEGFEKICDTVRHMISTLRAYLDEIIENIKYSNIGIEQFNYPEFNNGCEIIP